MPLPAVAGDPATALDAPDGLVITRAIARKYFGQDAPLGQSLLINGSPLRVTAVIQDLPPTPTSSSTCTGPPARRSRRWRRWKSATRR